MAETRELSELLSRVIGEAVFRRLDAVERVQLAIDRLAHTGPVSELIERLPNEAAEALGLDRVLLSRVEDGRLQAAALHCGEGAGDPIALLASLQTEAAPLEYPSIEAEMLRRRQSRVVGESEASVGQLAFGAIMRWREYVAAPIALEGRVIAFLHGDRPVSREPLSPLEGRALEHLGDPPEPFEGRTCLAARPLRPLRRAADDRSRRDGLEGSDSDRRERGVSTPAAPTPDEFYVLSMASALAEHPPQRSLSRPGCPSRLNS